MSLDLRSLSALLAVVVLCQACGRSRDDFVCAARTTVLASVSHPTKENLWVTPQVKEPIGDGWCDTSHIGLVLVREFSTKGMASFRVSCEGTPMFVARFYDSQPPTRVVIDPLSDYANIEPLPEPDCKSK